MSIAADLTAAVEAFEFARPAPGQLSLFREPKPRTAKGQLLLADSGVSDQPVSRPKPEAAMPPEVTAPKQVAPLAGQKSMFSEGLELPTLEPVHHAVGKRFGIPPEAVRDAMNTHPDVLAKRDKYFPPSSSRDEAVGPTLDYEKLPISSARIDYSRHTTGDTANAPIDYLREFDPHSLKLSEDEDGMKTSGSVMSYADWARAGHVPPPVSVFDSSNGNGDLVSTNRRRVLAARMAGRKLIGWHGRNNDETGLPLKYGDILKAAKEFHGQQFSRDPATESAAIPMFHGARQQLPDAGVGAMMTTDPVWAAGYATKTNQDTWKDEFHGAVHEIHVNAKNPLLHRGTLHDAEGEVIRRAKQVPGYTGGDFRTAAAALGNHTGHDYIYSIGRDGKPSGAISLKSGVAPVLKHHDPRQIITSAHAGGDKRIPSNLLDAAGLQLFSRDPGPVEFSAWREEDHPRESKGVTEGGEFTPLPSSKIRTNPDWARQFAESGAASVVSRQDWKDHSRNAKFYRTKMNQIFESGLESSGVINPSKRDVLYREAAMKAMSRMSARAMAVFCERCHRVEFRHWASDVDDEIRRIAGEPRRLPSEPAVYIGGWVERYDGKYLLLDGGLPGYEYDEDVDDASDLRTPTGVYAHEFSHVIDTDADNGGRISGSHEWKSAWSSEIATPEFPLSKYAATNPVEGFAEFGRLMLAGTQRQIEAAREMFPACFKVWKSHDLSA